MAFEDWEKRPNGDIATNPLMGYETATFPGHGILRIQHAEDPADVSQGGGTHLQVGMTSAQARELGQALIRLAEMVDRPVASRMQ